MPGQARVEIVIPVRNEKRDLGPAVRRLRAYCDDSFPFAARITIADNGSTDGTWVQALELADEFPLVRAARIERPGRGGALRSIWSSSDASVYAYMDVDLSTDLNALLPLVAPLLSGHSDVAIGTRLARAPATHDGHGLVLRHRTAGAGGAGRAAHPRGATGGGCCR